MKVSDVMLERFTLDELPTGQAAQLRDALAREASLRDRLRRLTSAREQEATRELADGVRTRLARPSRPSPVAWWLVPAAVAVVMSVIVWQPLGPTPAEETERSKGPDATLSIYRQTPSGSEQLDERAVAHTGDVIRIGYRLSGDAFGAIVSVDGRGTVTVHHPDNAPIAAPMTGGQSVLLAHAYELDDAPKWERFYLITGTTPFAIDTIVNTARRAGAGAAASPTLDLSPGMTQSTFLLQKDSRP